MSYLHIFLDIDGVIADFESHAVNTGIKDGKSLLYDRLDREWWASIPEFSGAREFYDELKQHGKVHFLSGVIMHPDCHSGKADWVIGFTGEDKWILRDLILCARKSKHLLAKSHTILIDDNTENVQAWKDAGGIAFLHTGGFEDTLIKIKTTVKNFKVK